MYVPYWTNDPVSDAERWASREDERPLLGKCEICGEEIHGGDGWYEPDDAYDIDGELICDDCLRKWAEKYKIE